MSPERWRQVDDLFQQALDIPTASRNEFLADACGPDLDLRREVEAMLAYEQPAGQLIGDMVGSAVKVWDSQQLRSMVDQRIGPYRVLRILGEGGMGVVYLATRDDDQFHKEVAIKVVKKGMDSFAILRRFRNERQILARLEHPNIARLLDGGTTSDGLPFFAMEFVDGLPVTHYCRQHSTNAAGRIRLFLDACAAVDYAHRNLVVHRDLKPSNILVTASGQVKLLDFGIAKVVEEQPGPEATQTATGLRMMTPHYASPEQVLGAPITTASDVYSLGAVLYELLTGEKPLKFDTGSSAEIERSIIHDLPPRPSTKALDIAEDLDYIILMALRKEPDRRYRSVAEFIQDIERHHAGLPVLARPDAFAYRAGKFIRRNRVQVLAAGIAAIGLLAGTVVALVQARRATREAQVARERFDQVRGLARFYLFDIHDKLARVPGTTEAREQMVRGTLEYLDKLAGQAGADLSLRLEIAAAYLKIGMVQASPFGPSLGKSAEARRSFEKGLTVMTNPPIDVKTLPPAARIQVESQMEALEARIGDNLQYGGSITGAKKAYESSLARAMEIRRLSPGPSSARTLAAAQQRLGGLALRFRDTAAARQHYEAALTLVEEIDAVEKSPASRDAVISARNGLADVLSLLGDYPAAEQHWRLILANNERLVSESRNTGSLQNLTHAYRQYSHVKANLGEYEDAIRHARKAIAVSEELTLADPKDIQALRLLALAHMALAGNQEFVDREAALRSYQQGLVYTRKVLAADPANVDAQVDELSNHLNIARAHVLQSRFQQAFEPLRVALDLAENLVRNNPDRNYLIAYRARALSYRAEARLGIGDRRGALESIEAAHRIAGAKENASVANLRREWIRSLALRGRIQLAFASDGTLDMAARRKHALAARESLEQAHKVFPVPGTGSRLPDLKMFYDRLLSDLDRARKLAAELGGS